MKRQALSAVNTNLSRAEQLAQWKEAKAQASDVKKRPRTAESSPEELKKQIKSLKDSMEEKDAKIKGLQTDVEARSRTIKSMTEKVSRLQKTRFKMEADCEALKLNIQQLKDVLRKSVIEREETQETIRELQQKCDGISGLQSHITELTLLNKCLSESSQPEPASKASNPSIQNVILCDQKLASVFESEKVALQAEIRALKSSNEAVHHRCEELLFNKQLLLQQNAELLESSMKYVAKKDQENRSERDNGLTSAMSPLQSELSESLDKSLKKTVQLQEEIAELRKQQTQPISDSH